MGMSKAEKAEAELLRLRSAVVKGWAFRSLPEEQNEAIRHYLDTGEMTEDFPYEHMHQHFFPEYYADVARKGRERLAALPES